jgi:hypothetical protein
MAEGQGGRLQAQRHHDGGHPQHARQDARGGDIHEREKQSADAILDTSLTSPGIQIQLTLAYKSS